MVLFYEIKVNCKDKTNENQVLYGGTPSTSAGATSQLTCREGHIWETGEARDVPKPAQCRSVNGVAKWTSDITCLGFMDFISFIWTSKLYGYFLSFLSDSLIFSF